MNQVSSYQHWTRRQALWFIAGAASSVGLNACARSATTTSDASTETNSTAVSFGTTPWIGNTAIYIAQEQGFFQDEALDFDLKIFPSVAESFPVFLTGEIQGSLLAAAEAQLLASRGADYRIVAIMDTSVGADAILARNSIADIQDFRGKQIGVQQGGVGHFFLLQVLAEAGLSENDVTIVNMLPDAAAAAYQAGNIDIVYSYSPFVEEANAVQKDGRTIYDTARMPTAIVDVYAFRSDFIESNPQAVQAFVNGVFKALDFLETNPDEAAAIAAKPLEITPDELKTQLEGVDLPDLQTNIEMLSNTESDLYVAKSLNEIGAFLEAQGQIETVPDAAQYIDPQFVMALSNDT
ncbi:myristoyl transferase [filamentous cyanobacterium CCP1]|nr:myristoyl transferase [filamentous cyanobacterium CCP2]PSB67955.1 myristoyl transferase [filamentous cyanobacterium CCP1]